MCGYIDLTGSVCIEPRFYNAGAFAEGVASVLTGSNGYAFINYAGEIVTNEFYSHLERFSDGLALAKKGSKFYYLDKSLKTILGPYENAGNFREDVAWATIDGQECYINRQGEVLFHNAWDWICRYCYDDRIDFLSGGKDGFLDRAGNVVIEPIYDSVDGFSDGVAFVEKDSRRIAINTNGDELFSINAEAVDMFREGLAAFQFRQNWGYVDRHGAVQIQPQFYIAGLFRQGFAIVVDK